jgi:lysophospholipase L1-like esterase
MIRRLQSFGEKSLRRIAFRSRLGVAAAAALMLGMGCGEPTAPPEPVATVTITPAAVVLVPGGTELVATVPKGLSGKTLTNRETVWSSSDESIVRVAAGMVSGVAKGTAKITATVEGIAATVDVEVRDGGVVTAAGASFSLFDGAVSVGVPAGAVAATRNIAVKPAANPPAARRFMGGSAYDFGPEGVAFAQPITISIKYDPSKLNTGSPESGLQLYEAVQGAWRVVTGSTVDVNTHIASGSVTRLGTYGVLMQPIVDTVRVTVPAGTIVVQTAVQFAAVIKDSAGATLTRPTAWSSSDASILKIDAATGAANALLPGSVTVTAASEGKSGTATVTVVPGPPAHMARVTAESVSGAAGVALASPPAVKITDAFGNAISGFTVTFAVASGGGNVTGATAVSSANGFASPASWTLGKVAGTNTLTATGTGLPESPITFTAIGNPGPAANIAANSSTTLTGTANGPVSTLPSVKVTDAFGNAVAGTTVVFTPANGGTVTGGSVVTDASGIATVASWRLGVTPGPQTLQASVSGLTGSPVTFTATAAAPVPSVMTAVAGGGQTVITLSSVPVAPSVKITDAAGVPVAGMTVTFAVTGGGGSVSGATPVTNTEGVATLGGWVVGGLPGENTVSASAGSLAPVSFSVNAIAPTPVAVAIVQGQNQTAPAASLVPVPIAVKVTDAEGRAVPGFSIVFAITSGGGAISGPSTVVTNTSGIAVLGGWTLGIGTNTLTATASGLSGSPIVFTAKGVPFMQLVTFGDSNTDYGYQGTSPTIRASSYISNTPPRLGPNDPNSPFQLAGKIEAKWKASRSETIRVVNHGIASTRTGTGRTGLTSPNALEVVNGLTRFQGEVLGLGYPWSGGETPNSAFPSGPILRVQAFNPRVTDFVYVSLGTNDIPTSAINSIVPNLSTMVDMWVATGLPTNHFIITTIPPRDGTTTSVPGVNAAIRNLASTRGLRLVDLALFASNDDGVTWKNPAYHVDGDLFHYSEEVRNWLADRVFEIINAP